MLTLSSTRGASSTPSKTTMKGRLQATENETAYRVAPLDRSDKVLAMKQRMSASMTAWLAAVLWAAGTAHSQQTAAPASLQTQTDEYTRYELLSPESASFAIRYEVTATATGAKYYFNPIRKGSVA